MLVVRVRVYPVLSAKDLEQSVYMRRAGNTNVFGHDLYEKGLPGAIDEIRRIYERIALFVGERQNPCFTDDALNKFSWEPRPFVIGYRMH